jgi:thymidylate synthase (FAD)
MSMTPRQQPGAKVIGYSKFLGVPEEVWPEGGYEAIEAAGQDQGSDMARLIECAGRECYDSYGKGRTSEAFHEHILDVAHGSVTEHATINFRIWNVSRGLTHELVRHRAGVAISQRSTRYVNEAESPWIWHPLIYDAIEWSVQQGDLGLAQSGTELQRDLGYLEEYARGRYSQAVELVRTYLERGCGVKGTDQIKQARGAARGALGNALATSLIWTANVRALRGCIEQRAAAAADGEIRQEFDFIYLAACEFCPEYFGDYVRVETADGIGFGLKTDHRKL